MLRASIFIKFQFCVVTLFADHFLAVMVVCHGAFVSGDD